MMLAFDFIEIDFIAAVRIEERPPVQLERRDDHIPFQEVPCLPEIPDRENLDPVDDRRFRGILIRNQ